MSYNNDSRNPNGDKFHMMEGWYGKAFHITGPLCGEPPITGGFTAQGARKYRPLMISLLSKQAFLKMETSLL